MIDNTLHNNALFSKNIEYFRRFQPSLYKRFNDFVPSTPMEKLELEVASEDRLIEEELEGWSVLGMDLAKPSDYPWPRFYSRWLSDLIEKSPYIVKNDSGGFDLNRDSKVRAYFAKTVPILVVLGGFANIEGLLRRVNVINLTILEPDPEMFFFSLHRIDWEAVFTQFYGKMDRSISLVVGSRQSTDLLYRVLALHLARQAPLFPLAVKYWVSRNDCGFSDIVKWLQKDKLVSLCGWGSYDDELNQVVQSLHNIKLNSPVISSLVDSSNSSLRADLEALPVCIVGSGPSLDRREHQLRALSQCAFLISVGSSITTLHAKGIKPDLHVELESCFRVTSGYLDAIEDDDYLNTVDLIAPVQMNPLIVSRFRRCRMVLKYGCTASDLLNNEGLKLLNSAPSAINLAASFVLKLGVKRLIFMGADFGFFTDDRHHAQGSVYFKGDINRQLSSSVDFEQQTMLKTKSISGRLLRTRPLYFISRLELDNLLKDSISKSENRGRTLEVWNLSDGMPIYGTRWIGEDEACDYWIDNNKSVSDTDLKRESLVNYIFELPVIHDVGYEKTGRKVAQICKQLEHVHGDISDIVKQVSRDELDSVLGFVQVMKSYLEDGVQKHAPAVYYLLYGSIQAFCTLLLLFEYSIREEGQGALAVSEIEAFRDAWYQDFCLFIQKVGGHFTHVTTDLPEMSLDSWLRHGIDEPEIGRGGYGES